MHWSNLTHFAERLGHETLSRVKHSALHSGRFFDPDWTAPLGTLTTLSRDAGFAEVNISSTAFFAAIAAAATSGNGTNNTTAATTAEATDDGHAWAGAPEGAPEPARLVYFSDISPGLHAEVKPDTSMYLSSDDWMYRKQFVWVSTAGSNTHLHFDQDYNVFVQMVGRKRFTLFPPSETPHLHPYPRAHPLWHKSRLDFDRPDLARFPDYIHAHGEEAELEPGDLLYVPPYYWHHVETLTTPSVSLSTLSHDDSTRNAMSVIYKMDHKFDRLAEKRGQMFALRLYLDLLVHEVVGQHALETVRFFARLLNTRYRGLEALFEDDPDICAAERPHGIPTAQHVYGDCVTDMKLVAPIFIMLPGEKRDVLLADYIEDLVAPIVGATRIYSFFRYCFAEGYEYYVTELSTPEHALWEYKVFHDVDEPAVDPADDKGFN